MHIFIASDHGGFQLKKTLIEVLQNTHDIQNLGPSNTDSVDYPDYAHELCQKLSDDDEAVGILICGTGLGMSMAANSHPHIRAALCTNETMSRYARWHNNANVLCLGERVVGSELAKSIVEVFLSTSFEGGRHSRRVEKISSKSS